MAAAECTPIVKVGGLGDVVGSLPLALHKLGIDVRVIMPLYGSIDRKKYGLKKIYSELEVPSGLLLVKVDIYEAKLPGTSVPVYFIDAPDYFRFEEVYTKGNNSERFLFFSLAALYSLPILKFQPDVIHCQDSHTALIPDIIKTSNLEYLRGLKTLYSIHNFFYQGKTEIITLSTGNLHVESLKSLTADARNGDINFMVQGVLNADLVNTVSPTYAKEITTSAYGAGLDKVIQKRKADLCGILNGIDTEFFNPRTDRYIKTKYTEKSLNKKLENKIHLQKKLGLPADKEMPVVGLVSRLVWQKGIDLVTEHFSRLRCQFVFLGTGKDEYERSLKNLAKKYPEQFSAQIGFDTKLAQEIYAGADIFLMPSRFEPCGLGQMIAMRYGTLPVVRATGGLKDTVTPDLGFSFEDISKSELFKTLKNALDIYYEDKDKWQKMQIRAMRQDFSWTKSAKEYIVLYKNLIKK